jgi:hypothetical protein
LRIFRAPSTKVDVADLAASETAFCKQAPMNFQIPLTRRQDVGPMTRDDINRGETRLRGVEGSTRPRLRIAGEWCQSLCVTICTRCELLCN